MSFNNSQNENKYCVRVWSTASSLECRRALCLLSRGSALAPRTVPGSSVFEAEDSTHQSAQLAVTVLSWDHPELQNKTVPIATNKRVVDQFRFKMQQRNKTKTSGLYS